MDPSVAAFLGGFLGAFFGTFFVGVLVVGHREEGRNDRR